MARIRPQSFERITALHNRARSHEEKGEFAKAARLHREAIKILAKKSPGPDAPDGQLLAQALAKLANLHRILGQYRKAEPLFSPRNCQCQTRLRFQRACTSRDPQRPRSALQVYGPFH